jgi:predicted esterase
MPISTDIHADQPVLTYGADLESAQLAVILLHGRGASAESMLPLADEIGVEGVHYRIPQAAQFRWYPQTAFGPIEANQPDLSSALAKIDLIIDELRADGFADSQIILGGFSQGACLSSEYVARNARRYGGLFVLSGALIGPPGTPRSYPGSLESTPVFIGGSDVDPWIPDDLQRETAEVLSQMGAEVEFKIYNGMPHTVNQDEILRVQELFGRAIGSERTRGVS